MCQACNETIVENKSMAERIEEYNAEPHKCLYCDGDILHKKGKRLNLVQKQKYCSRDCVNAEKRDRITVLCLNCNKTMIKSKGTTGKYCSSKCQAEYQWTKITIPKILKGKISYNIPLKRYLIEIEGYFCKECGIYEWNGKPLVLQLDHIDGNSDNNFVENLRLLCANCHSQTPTYKGGNKKNLKNTKRNRQQREIYARKTK